MDIVYAAEKPSIARLLSEHMRRRVRPEEIKVSENPEETGSFYIGFNLDKFVLSPNGEIRVQTGCSSSSSRDIAGNRRQACRRRHWRCPRAPVLPKYPK